MVLSMLCWGAWANTLKATGKWRFELYYFDFAIGALLLSLLAAITFGTLGFDGFSFMDDVMHASKRQDLYDFLGGVVFNLGFMFLAGAVSVSGLTVAFPAAMGLAIAVGVGWGYMLAPQGNTAMLFAGAAIVVIAGLIIASAFKNFKLSQVDELVKSGQVKSTRRRVSIKGVYLALAGGIFIGSYFPLVDLARAGDTGLGPYSIGVFFTVGILLSTFLYSLFFMNLPVSGSPIEMLDYVKGNWKVHMLGFAGGAIWYCGMLLANIAGVAEGPAKLGTGLTNALTLAPPVIAALCGIFVWREFKGSDAKVKAQIFVALVLFLLGAGLVAVAPVWQRG